LLLSITQQQQQEELFVLNHCWPARSCSSSGRLMMQTALTVSCKQGHLGW
jgi:hypothetical protein